MNRVSARLGPTTHRLTRVSRHREWVKTASPVESLLDPQYELLFPMKDRGTCHGLCYSFSRMPTCARSTFVKLFTHRTRIVLTARHPTIDMSPSVLSCLVGNDAIKSDPPQIHERDLASIIVVVHLPHQLQCSSHQRILP